MPYINLYLSSRKVFNLVKAKVKSQKTEEHTTIILKQVASVYFGRAYFLSSFDAAIIIYNDYTRTDCKHTFSI